MKTLRFLLLALIIIAGCTSSRKYLQRAQYDAAINKATSQLRKDPENTDELQVLQEAYKKANQINIDRISFLKSSGEPDVWDQIFAQYNSLKYRQDNIKTLPDKVLNDLRFVPVNYDQEIFEAKKRAAEFFYNRGMSCLDRNDRQNARNAFYDFQKVKQYYSAYKDVDDRMNEAAFKGTNNVLFKMQNQTRMILPRDFEEELLKISVNDLNSQWLNYDTRADKNLYYDYNIILSVKGIAVSPEEVKEEAFTDEKEVPNGFRYALDAKGNVKKDTAGNDIKIPIVKIITCKVIVTHQLKKATITGTLDYVNNRTGQLIRTHPVTAEWIFENHSAIAVGDHNALRHESKKLLGNKFMPFPPDPEMIMRAGEHLKNITKDIIWNNKGLINN